MRALAALFEHELVFEFIPIDLDAGDHKKQSFLSLNGIIVAWIDVEDHEFGPKASKRNYKGAGGQPQT
ncbi:hypothetical protein QYF36_009189 [Acer negundo]|nr:hypothetical protein QYF36_009189 [Acer negundo]